MKSPNNLTDDRRGAVAVLIILLLIAMIAMGVFAVDYGYLLVVRTDLQRAADNAALAAVRELIPDANGNQDLDAARAAVRQYATANLGNESFNVPDADITIGRYDPATIYSSLAILDTGIFDTVRVTLRRDDLTNTSVALYLARVLGMDSADVSVTSTAVLQKARFLPPGSDILPITIRQDTWEANGPGDEWSIYGDGRLLDANGNEVPGNWGTLDVGTTSNANSDIVDQITNGLRQEDLNSLHQDGTIPDSTSIDSQQSMWLNGDTGLSAGMKAAIRESHGTRKLIPIYDTLGEKSNGGNTDFHVVGWGMVEIVDSSWNGNNNTFIRIRKTYSYDGDLRPHPDLDNTSEIIDAVYTSPVLVE